MYTKCANNVFSSDFFQHEIVYFIVIHFAIKKLTMLINQVNQHIIMYIITVADFLKHFNIFSTAISPSEKSKKYLDSDTQSDPPGINS